MSESEDHRNDMELLTPLLVMGLIVVCGALLVTYLGHMPTL